MTIYTVVGWDICPHCGKTYEVYATYISERRIYCKHPAEPPYSGGWYKLVFIEKVD